MRVYYRRLLLSLGVMLWSLSLSSPPLFSSTLSLLPSFFHSYILFLYPLLFCFCLYHCNFPFIERVPITTTAYYLLSAWLSFLLLWEFTPRSIGHNILASLVSLILRVSCSLSGYYLFDLLHPRPVVPGLTIARGWPGPILFLQVGGILRLTAFFSFSSFYFLFFFLSGGSWSFLPCLPVLLQFEELNGDPYISMKELCDGSISTTISQPPSTLLCLRQHFRFHPPEFLLLVSPSLFWHLKLTFDSWVSVGHDLQLHSQVPWHY